VLPVYCVYIESLYIGYRSVGLVRTENFQNATVYMSLMLQVLVLSKCHVNDSSYDCTQIYVGDLIEPESVRKLPKWNYACIL
jgi:hypothetical protein